MKKLGAYIGETVHGIDIVRVRKNTFVWYEVVRHLTARIGEDVYEVSIWSLNSGYPNGRKPDARFKTTNKHLIENTVIPIKEISNKYCIEWENNGPWQIKECMFRYDYGNDYECVTGLKVDQFGSNNSCHFEFLYERAMFILKNATITPIYKVHKLTPVDMYDFPSLTIPETIDDMIKKQLKESLEKSTLNSCYGIGGFTTKTDPFTIVKMLPHEEAAITYCNNDVIATKALFDNQNKETKTMEKKKMTETDSFLKNLNGITITSTYSKLDHGCGKPYYIYYPEMDITEEMADTLLTILLMSKKEYLHKVVFNPEKGTTTIYGSYDNRSVTVRCRDGEFDYILGYNMARIKLYLCSDDYNWFNKIKNHRKTHIEYTEKKPTKKGGKK